MAGFFHKFKAKFREQTPTFQKAAQKLFGAAQLDAASVDELEEALYGADFGVETTSEIIDEIQDSLKRDKTLRGEDALRIGAEVLSRTLSGAEPTEEARSLPPVAPGPRVLSLVGVNGSGKTTTTAKLGWYFQQQGRSVLLGACDTFRAAANEQLKHWADTLDLELVASQHGSDSAAVAFDSYRAAQARHKDLLILDTAGRLHTRSNLMDELKKISRVLEKQNPEAPHDTWLVLDGSLGSNSIEQARKFHEAIGITGLVITKLDGTSRGGALVGIFRELQIPVYFVGIGEQKEDLQPFRVQDYVEAIFGNPTDNSSVS